MNTDRINELADHIENLEHTLRVDVRGDTDQFNMDRLNFICGSPACIAGHAVAKYGHEIDYVNGMDIMTSAAVVLDISSISSRGALFAPSENRTGGFPMNRITPEMAAWVLRAYAETGEVRWSDAIRIYS